MTEIDEHTFDIPVVLFLFRRNDTIKRIIDKISVIRPAKMYLLCDQGRNDTERQQVSQVKQTVETLIDWPCEVVKNYADENRGVYGNIGLGAKWVFEREKWAIFLEDDNLPDVSFFDYCEKLLKIYEENDDILWICGTNYLGEYRNKNNESYMFTRNLLPCGWASWASKFLKYYDFGFASVKHESDIKNIRDTYVTRALYKQEQDSIITEYRRALVGERYHSWDFHMIYSLRNNRKYGISPATNLIENIGVDAISEHGGSSKNDPMAQRFCGVATKKIEGEFVHPTKVAIDLDYETKIEKIITHPLKMRISKAIAICVRKIFKIPNGVKTREYFFRKDNL